MLVRLDMVREGRTYELLITRHAAGNAANGCRLSLETRMLFRGVHGRLELDLSGRDKAQAGAVLPTFYSLSGEAMAIPEQFTPALRSIVKAANGNGCSHCHYVNTHHSNNNNHHKTKRIDDEARAGEL